MRKSNLYFNPHLQHIKLPFKSDCPRKSLGKKQNKQQKKLTIAKLSIESCADEKLKVKKDTNKANVWSF